MPKKAERLDAGEAVAAAAAAAVVAAVGRLFLGAVADDQRHGQERALPGWVGREVVRDLKSTAHQAEDQMSDVPLADQTSAGQLKGPTSTVPAEV